MDTLAGDVEALDLRTGTNLWSVHLDNEVMSTPVVVNGLVIVGTGRNASAANATFAYAETSRQHSEFWGRDEGDHVEALDTASGKIHWAYRTSGEDMPSPVNESGKLVFSNGDGHLYALDLGGQALWRRELGGIGTMSSAIAVNRAVFVSICSGEQMRGATVAFDLSGNPLWHASYGDCDSSPTYGDKTLFVSGISGNRTSFGFGGRTIVSALRAKDGTLRWKYQTPEAGSFTRVGSSERAIAGTFSAGLYFQPIVTSDEVVAFDAGTGNVRWRLRTQGPVKMSPVIHDGSAFFGDTGGVFYKVRARDGKVLATKLFAHPFATSPPIVVGGMILCANGSSVCALECKARILA